jgi:hypothetical protein
MAIKCRWNRALALLVLFAANPSSAASMVVFDFDHIQSSSKKGPRASDVESYMENLFGADLTVSANTVASGSKTSVRNLRVLGMPSDTLAPPNAFLKVGKGKGNSGIAFDFGDNPIDSFSVDFRLLKKAKSFSIVADGVTITQLSLSKAQRKTGLTGHQSAYYFDGPVQTLQFVGLKKKSFSIDNLAINLPLEFEDDGSFNQATNATEVFADSNSDSWRSATVFSLINSVTPDPVAAAVPEPASAFLLAAGFVSIIAAKRRLD